MNPIQARISLSTSRLCIEGLNKQQRLATVSTRLFTEKAIGPMKENCWNKFLRFLGLRKWVVLKVATGENQGWVKVNQQSLRKRLGMSVKDFKTHLKGSIDFTEIVRSRISIAPLPPSCQNLKK